MPKTPSDHLFRLIKSLTGSEKRYFKLFIGEKDEKDNLYLQLFDAIDAQTEFDEDQLRLAIYGDQPIESRKYSELKAYLYELLLKALQAFDSKTSIDFRLRHLLASVRVLFRRSHFEEARQILAKAKKLAEKYEQFSVLLDITAWEKRIAYAMTDIAFLDRELPGIQQAEQRYDEQLGNLIAYRNLFLRLLVLLRKDAALRNQQSAQILQEIIQHPLLNKEVVRLSTQADMLYLRIYSLYYYALKNYEGFYQTSKQLIALMEAQPHLLREDVSEYISALSNYVMSCGWLQRFDEVEGALPKFRKIQPNTQDDRLKIHRQYFMIKLSLCIQKGDFEEGLRALADHQQALKNFHAAAFQKHTFYFQYFYIYFGSGDYDRALESLNDWLSLSVNVERKDLQSLARILSLIIHYEMGNAILLQSLLRSTYRFLKKQTFLFEYERKMLEFFRKTEKLLSKKELKQAFIQLKEELKNLFQNKDERAMLELFNIQAWVESKIQNKPFYQVVQEHYRPSQPA